MMETGPEILGAVASLTKGIITASFKIIGAASGLFKSTIRSISEIKCPVSETAAACETGLQVWKQRYNCSPSLPFHQRPGKNERRLYTRQFRHQLNP
ncbi:MAG: hypothetical protein OXC57_03555 [Rhodobacteraceae bacterium]|nr:hypothetical protein [Paracoccaceae bacterium]